VEMPCLLASARSELRQLEDSFAMPLAWGINVMAPHDAINRNSLCMFINRGSRMLVVASGEAEPQVRHLMQTPSF